MEKYRYDQYKALYVYSAENKAYIFVNKGYGTKYAAIAAYERAKTKEEHGEDTHYLESNK